MLGSGSGAKRLELSTPKAAAPAPAPASSTAATYRITGLSSSASGTSASTSSASAAATSAANRPGLVSRGGTGINLSAVNAATRPAAISTTAGRPTVASGGGVAAALSGNTTTPRTATVSTPTAAASASGSSLSSAAANIARAAATSGTAASTSTPTASSSSGGGGSGGGTGSGSGVARTATVTAPGTVTTHAAATRTVGVASSTGTSSAASTAAAASHASAPAPAPAPASGGAGGAGAAASATAATAGAGKGMSPHGFVKREKLKFTLKDLTLSTTVGTGTFGRVRVAFHKPTKTWCALKIMKKSEIIRLKQVEHIKSELRILSTVQHPFIVNMLGHMQDDKRLYVLLEYVPGGEVFSHLRREGKFSNNAARFYAAEITLAFEYLHLQNVVYRDLKPENLLLTAKGHVKITDFGFAKLVDDRTYTLCGTPEYLAPEIIQSKGHNKGVDWWAIGILIYEMLAGYPPFYDESAYGIYQKILAGKIEWPKHFSPEACDLIKKLLISDRTRRLGCLRAGAADIKDHPWFARMNWDALYACTVAPPFVPKVKEPNDTSNFDDYPDSDEDTAARVSAADAAMFTEIDSF